MVWDAGLNKLPAISKTAIITWSMIVHVLSKNSTAPQIASVSFSTVHDVQAAS